MAERDSSDVKAPMSIDGIPALCPICKKPAHMLMTLVPSTEPGNGVHVRMCGSQVCEAQLREGCTCEKPSGTVRCTNCWLPAREVIEARERLRTNEATNKLPEPLRDDCGRPIFRDGGTLCHGRILALAEPCPDCGHRNLLDPNVTAEDVAKAMATPDEPENEAPADPKDPRVKQTAAGYAGWLLTKHGISCEAPGGGPSAIMVDLANLIRGGDPVSPRVDNPRSGAACPKVDEGATRAAVEAGCDVLLYSNESDDASWDIESDFVKLFAAFVRCGWGETSERDRETLVPMFKALERKMTRYRAERQRVANPTADYKAALEEIYKNTSCSETQRRARRALQGPIPGPPPMPWVPGVTDKARVAEEGTLESDHCGDTAISSKNGYSYDGDAGRCIVVCDAETHAVVSCRTCENSAAARELRDLETMLNMARETSTFLPVGVKP